MRRIIQVAGTIFTALYEAIGLIQMATNGIPAGSVIHRWDLVGMFFAFLIFIGWVLLDRESQIRQLKGEKPAIQVTPEKSASGRFYLRVHNQGEKGEFKARIEVKEGIDHFNNMPAEYFAVWEESPETKNITLNKGDSARLRIATLQTQGPKRNWQLHRDFEKGSLTDSQTIGSTTWDVKPGEKKDVSITLSVSGAGVVMLMPKVILRIVITSNPSMQEAFSKDYSLTEAGLVEYVPEKGCTSSE